jgi:hypothetical protein
MRSQNEVIFSEKSGRMFFERNPGFYTCRFTTFGRHGSKRTFSSVPVGDTTVRDKRKEVREKNLVPFLKNKVVFL